MLGNALALWELESRFTPSVPPVTVVDLVALVFPLLPFCHLSLSFIHSVLILVTSVPLRYICRLPTQGAVECIVSP